MTNITEECYQRFYVIAGSGVVCLMASPGKPTQAFNKKVMQLSVTSFNGLFLSLQEGEEEEEEEREGVEEREGRRRRGEDGGKEEEGRKRRGGWEEEEGRMRRG